MSIYTMYKNTINEQLHILWYTRIKILTEFNNELILTIKILRLGRVQYTYYMYNNNYTLYGIRSIVSSI